MSRKKFSLFPEQRQDPGQVGGARWSCRGLVERAASFEGSMERESRHSASAERQVGALLGHGRVESQAWASMGKTKVEQSKVTEKGVAAGTQLTLPSPCLGN